MAHGFYIRRGELITEELDHSELTPAAKCVGTALLKTYLNSESENAWMSVGTLAQDLAICPNTGRRALGKMVELGLLGRERRTGQTTLYFMGKPWRALRTVDRRGPKPWTRKSPTLDRDVRQT